MTESSKQHKRGKRHRLTKNAYIDIDSVSIDPGINFRNWIPVVRQKLKERESKLLEIKTQRIQEIINEQLSKYIKMKTKYVISEELINIALQQLYDTIDRWHGVDTTRARGKFSRFRDYFSIGKNWWDQTKKRLFGGVFWIQLFHHIELFLKEQNISKNGEDAMIVIMKGLFDGSVKYNNTKQQSLINAGVVVSSPEIQEYLLKLNDKITIKQWIEEQKINGQGQSSKVIADKTRNELQRVKIKPFEYVLKTEESVDDLSMKDIMEEDEKKYMMEDNSDSVISSHNIQRQRIRNHNINRNSSHSQQSQQSHQQQSDPQRQRQRHSNRQHHRDRNKDRNRNRHRDRHRNNEDSNMAINTNTNSNTHNIPKVDMPAPIMPNNGNNNPFDLSLANIRNDSINSNMNAYNNNNNNNNNNVQMNQNMNQQQRNITMNNQSNYNNTNRNNRIDPLLLMALNMTNNNNLIGGITNTNNTNNTNPTQNSIQINNNNNNNQGNNNNIILYQIQAQQSQQQSVQQHAIISIPYSGFHTPSSLIVNGIGQGQYLTLPIQYFNNLISYQQPHQHSHMNVIIPVQPSSNVGNTNNLNNSNNANNPNNQQFF